MDQDHRQIENYIKKQLKLFIKKIKFNIFEGKVKDFYIENNKIKVCNFRK